MAILEARKLSGTGRNQYIVEPEDTLLITGANGFVGSKVVETLLEYGFTKMRCLVRSGKNITRLQQLADASKAQVEIFQGNLLSRDDCEHASTGVSVVYHLAAGVGKWYADCFMNSVVTTRNLLDAVIKQQTMRRFVNVSSIAVYSNEKIRRGGLLDESCEVDARLVERHEPYTYAKAKQDEIVLEYAQKHNLPYVIVRPSVVFGPGKAKITDRVGTDTFGVFLHLGMNNRIPLTYVDNCADAIVLSGLIEGIEGQVLNILDDDLPKSSEFLRLYKRIAGTFLSVPVPYPVWFLFCSLWEKYSRWSEGQLPPVFNRRACAVYWKGNSYSNEKAKELLRWRPRVAMDEALQAFFLYMKEMKAHSK